jgi:hypothetical protein
MLHNMNQFYPLFLPKSLPISVLMVAVIGLVFAPCPLQGQSWQVFKASESPFHLFIEGNTLWAGGFDYGVIQKDLTTGELLTQDWESPNGLLSNEVTTLASGPGGTVWAGHKTGISLRQGGTWRNARFNDPRWVAAQIAPVSAQTAWIRNNNFELWWFDGAQLIDTFSQGESVFNAV